MDKHAKMKCKYGAECYQKNKNHLDRYLHPPKNVRAITTTTPRDEKPSELSKKRQRSPVPNLSRSPDKKVDIDQTTNTNYPNAKQLKLTPEEQSDSAQCSFSSSPGKDIDFKENKGINEEETLLQNSKQFIKTKFLVDMPDDFYIFWKYCKANAKQNEKPERILLKFGLTLFGPFDVLAGKFYNDKIHDSNEYLRHCRYYYDPPEFQTIFKKDKSGIHYGYWRDDPQTNACFIAKNDVDKGCEINIVADNIFSAILHFLNEDAIVTPFNKSAIASTKKSLEEWANQHNIKLDTFGSKMKSRNHKIVTKTFHKAGLIVPVEKKSSIGYRDVIESDAILKSILDLLKDVNGDQSIIKTVMGKLQPFITAADIAVDESDFGASIELGMDFFCCGAPALHTVLIKLLENGYRMLQRPQFISIIKAHLANRQNGTDLSIV